MTELVQTIKRAALEAVEAGEPALPCLGTVSGVDPLEIRLHQRLTVGENRLLVLMRAQPLEVGARVALLRFAGGQRYLVLGGLAGEVSI